MTLPFGVTVTVHRFTEDRKGNRTEVSTHTVANVGIAPRAGGTGGDASTEVNNRASTVNTSRVLYGPFGADITALDVIELPDGSRWEVDGEIGSWASPLTGWKPGVEVNIKRKTG